MLLQSHTARRIFLFNQNHDAKGRFATGMVSVLELPVKLEHAVVGKLKQAAQTVVGKLGISASPVSGKIGNGVKVVGGKLASVYFASWIAGRNAVAAVAHAKGLSDLEIKRLTAICSCYDALNSKAIFAGLEHSGFPGLAGASLFVPTASVAYLAHATISNPMAVMKAAKAAVMSAKRGIKDSFEMSRNMDAENAVGILADALKRHAGDELFAAILPQAMERSNNVNDAVALAEKALNEHSHQN
jgi:hypothetical protein